MLHLNSDINVTLRNRRFYIERISPEIAIILYSTMVVVLKKRFDMVFTYQIFSCIN